MNNSPEHEASILNLLRQLIRRDMAIRASRVMGQESVTSIEKRKKREMAELIIDELKNTVNSAHPAHELLSGLHPDAATLAQNERLAFFILGITRADDPNLYHDPKWLKQKRDALDLILESDPKLSETTDNGVYEKLRDRINNQIKKHDRNRRLEEFEKEKKMRERLSDAAREAEKRKIKAFGGETLEDYDPVEGENMTMEEIIEGIPVELSEEEEANFKKSINEVKRKNFYEGDKSYVAIAAQGFADKRRAIIKKLGKTEGAPDVDYNGPSIMAREHEDAWREMQRLQRAEATIGRLILESSDKHLGRLYEAMRSHEKGWVENQIKTNADYRDYWFYHIMEPILFNTYTEPSHQLYNLYVAGDMDIFLDIVRKIKVEGPNGELYGRRLAARYEILKNTIFQSHDMDFYAAHPQQDIKEFIGSTALFMNKYIDAAHQDPLVALAKRAYEMALLSIRDTNDNWIPRDYLFWNEGKVRASKLDDVAYGYLKKMIEFGQLYRVKTDDVTNLGLPSPSVWNRKQHDPTKPFTWQELMGYLPQLSDEPEKLLGEYKIAAALKQAKGLGLVDERFLEIIAYSRGTGTEYEQAGDPDESFSLACRQFNSVPYENIARHIAPMIHYYSRYRLGGEYYDAFFNMLLLNEWKCPWDPEIMKEVVKFHTKGDHEGAIGYLKSKGIQNGAEILKKRLTEAENPWEYSGIWGPWTSWRLGDATMSFDDWERDQAYATNVKLILAEQWATRQVRRKFESESKEYKAYRTEYRNRMKDAEYDAHMREAAIKDEIAERHGDFDDEFEKAWREAKHDLRPDGSGKRYDQLIDELWEKHKHDGDYEELSVKLKKVYLARTWIKAAMRSPLMVARYIDVEWKHDGYNKDKTSLRNKIINEILHTDIRQIDATRVKTAREDTEFDKIAHLESILGAISQNAIRDNRDLTDRDFDMHVQLYMQDDTLNPVERQENITAVENAKKFWHRVQEAMLGDHKTAERYYQELGIHEWTDAQKARQQGVRMHEIDWEQVKRIVEVEKEDGKMKKDAKGYFDDELFKTSCINNKLLDRDYKTTLFSTEDMGWEYLNIAALGERNPVRRAGDLASHVQFAQLFETYINDLLIAQPEIDEFVKAQKEMWTALSGDFVDIAIRSCYRIAYTTAMMYKKADICWAIPFASPLIALRKDASIMQMIRGRDRADAWGPNDLLHYVQAVGGKQILPKRDYHGLAAYAELDKEGYADRMGPGFKGFTSGNLGKAIGGTKFTASWEIASSAIMITTILNIIRALTAKSEEEES